MNAAGPRAPEPRRDHDGSGRSGLERLSRRTLPTLPGGVRRPAYDIAALRPGVLHLGCGAFHRAHQAVMTERAIEAQTPAGGVPPPWGIVAASLRTGRDPRALRRQDGLYTLLARGPAGARAEVVGALCRTLLPQDAAALAAHLRHPAIRVVTLTVTAAAYGTDPATGRLDPAHAEVQADLRQPDRPRSPLGVLVRGLAQRRQAGLAPPALLSCDNMPRNGQVLRQACIDFAALTDDALAGWIAAEVPFPCTMVDRIVPLPSDDDLDEVHTLLGVADAAPVCAEPFSQWVIARFDGPRPLWEAAGAEFVTDVAPWEASKLRLLNGGHLLIAGLGLLAGHETVAQAAADDDIAAVALRFMLDEQRPTLPASDHDIEAYAHQLLARWRNPGIADALQRVARDGSTKLAARLLDPLRENLAAGRPAPCTLLAIAAWICCATRLPGLAPSAALPDSRAALLERLGAQHGDDPQRLVDAVLGLRDVFGDELPQHPGVRGGLYRAVSRLRHGPLRTAMADALAGGRWQ